MSQATKQVKVVSATEAVPGQDFEPTAFYDSDGNPIEIGGGGESGPIAIADVTGLEARLTAIEGRLDAAEA